jgi:hypothetical protein
MMLEMGLKKEACAYEIRREYVLCDLLRTVKKKSYDSLKKVKVWFAGEEGRDTGGLTREMWRLFSIEMQHICSGDVRSMVVGHSEVPHKYIDDVIVNSYPLCSWSV